MKGENPVHYWTVTWLNLTLVSGFACIQHPRMSSPTWNNPSTILTQTPALIIQTFSGDFSYFFFLSDIPFAWSSSGEHRARLENFNMFFFLHFPPPTSGSLDQTAISYQLNFYCLTSKLKRFFSWKNYFKYLWSNITETVLIKKDIRQLISWSIV